MIKFLSVSGDVLVEEDAMRYTQMATPGLELGGAGNYLIATTQTSSARILVNEILFDLKPSSFLRVRGPRSWWDRHTEQVLNGLGRIWARIANDDKWDQGANAVAGVRG
jgi:hypothetical protein